jgi:predicted TIM-barrel fold metal-dependent hydrolase
LDKSPLMSQIDTHMHVNLKGFSIETIVKYLDKEKIDCCWLLTWEETNPGNWHYQHLSVEDVYQAHLKYPSRVIPFYAPDPHRSDAAVDLEHWYQKGIRGCGELKATLNWDSDGVKSILQMTRKLKLPIVFHMEASEYRHIPYSSTVFDKLLCYGLNTERKIIQIPKRVLQNLVDNFKPLKNRVRSYFFPGYMLDFASLEITLRDYPDVNLVAHGPMFWKYISDDATKQTRILPIGPVNSKGLIWRLLQDYPNLYADIAGASGLNALTRDRENARKFLSAFENKIFFGTDNLMHKHREFLDSLGLSKSICKKIYGENALSLVNHGK